MTLRNIGGRLHAALDKLEHSNPLTAVWELKRKYPQHFITTDRASDPRPWPAGFDPQRAPVYSRSEVYVDAPPQKIFERLVDGRGWSQTFPEVSDVKVDGPLKAGTTFSWRVFGTVQRSEVTLFEKDRALGWTAAGLGDTAYHRWFLVPEGRGTRVISEEIQQGPGPKAMAKLLNPALTALHRGWIDAIRREIA